MKKVMLRSLRIVACLVLPRPLAAGAQDYRARVQGSVVDESGGALPGATVTLRNDATGVAVTRRDERRRPLHLRLRRSRHVHGDRRAPGLQARPSRRTSRVQQRGDVTVDLTMAVGGVEERVVVEAPPVAVQFNSSSQDLTLERELIDQVPINGRNPYNLANLDPTMFNTPGTTENENRPYHHAYANDYDAGGGTRRANDVLLDGVPLGASFKTAYTPSMDAVEEITISKNSVDAENGHSLGGVISLNMKSGTNQLHGSGVRLRPRSEPQRDRRSDRDARVPGAGRRRPARHRAADVRRHDRRPDPEEQDLLLHVVRAVGRQQAADDRPHACRPSSSAAATSASRCSTAASATSTTRSRRRSTRPPAASCARRSPAT